MRQHTATYCNTLQHTATHCNTLQHTATHCNTLQHTAGAPAHKTFIGHTQSVTGLEVCDVYGLSRLVSCSWDGTCKVCCSVLQCVAVFCKSLKSRTDINVMHSDMGVVILGQCNPNQQTATHCNTLQHTATHYNTLQHSATLFNTLQHTPTHCNIWKHTATHCNTLQHTATHCNTL